MSTPLDLDAIRRRINHPLNDLMDLSKAAQADREWNVAAIAALISEVEALIIEGSKLRGENVQLITQRDNWRTGYEATLTQVNALRAKLEKAKEALMRCAPGHQQSAKAAIAAVLAELEKP